MKILHVCLGNFYVDNYSYQENLLPKYHLKMGHEVAVIASLASYDKKGKPCLLEHTGEYICNDGYKVIRVNFRSFLKPLNIILRRYENLFGLITKESPDVIFIHNFQFWDIRQVVKYAKRHPGIKIFADNHADYVNSGTNWLSINILHKIIWKYCGKSIEPYAEKIYGVTPLRCEYLNKVYGISRDKIDLLVLGADDEKINFNSKEQVRDTIRKQHNIEEHDFLILTGGKIDERKNIHLLMQAVEDMQNVKLIVFGNVTQQMKPTIDELSKIGNIRNIGWIDSDKVYDYFLASDLAVFPGTHSVYWEQAVGSGIPCVFKFWKGMDHVNIGGNCKFIYEECTETIKKTLLGIVNNSNLYNEMKRMAGRSGHKRFWYTDIARKAIGIKD